MRNSVFYSRMSLFMKRIVKEDITANDQRQTTLLCINVYRSILMEKSIHSWPLPENMDQDTWIRFLRRMADAWKTCCLQEQTFKPWEIIIFGSLCTLLFLSFFFMDLCHDSKKQENCNKNPPLWWIICMSAVVVSIVLLLKRMKKVFEAYTKEFRKSQEIVVMGMQLAFKCSGYSAEFIIVQCCGVTRRYIRFTPISESETERSKILAKDYQDAYKSQKDEAKNQRYDPAYWQPLEGQWEEKNRFGLGKVTHKWIFKRTASADTFHSQYECNFHTIACAFMPSKKLSYHLEGNLLLSDDVTPSLPSEIFRLGGNDYSVAFYRVGCSQIWKVEGSTCMQYKLEGRIVSEDDIISTSFWSTQEPIAIYHKVETLMLR